MEDDIRRDLMIGLHSFLEKDIGEHLSVVYDGYSILIRTRSRYQSDTNNVKLELTYYNGFLILINEVQPHTPWLYHNRWTLEDPTFNEKMVSEAILTVANDIVKCAQSAKKNRLIAPSCNQASKAT